MLLLFLTLLTVASTRNWPGEDKAAGVTDVVELVGAGGRLGSHILRLEDRQVQAIPRGLSPGCISSPGAPIYVATPSNTWDYLYSITPCHRREDLVFWGNGLPPSNATTTVLPHYAVHHVDGPAITNRQSPPTVCFGKHSLSIQKMLQTNGIRVEVVDSFSQLKSAAARKILWSSCLWLLCHEQEPSITVSEISQDRLRQLVQEMWPQNDLDETLGYLNNYSQSIPDAIPSKSLALEELSDRNGLFFRKFGQPLHHLLLRKVAGDAALLLLQQESEEEKKGALSTSPEVVVTRSIPWLGLSVYGELQSDKYKPPRSVVVVGGGIMGRSIALNLERLGVEEITIIDPNEPTIPSVTTRASWAWINANQKQPASYRWLNQLGMLAWHRDPVLHDLPQWCGSLVRVNVQSESHASWHSGYLVEGPLSQQRFFELEPNAVFKDSGEYYYFPSEGSVDPVVASERLLASMSTTQWVQDTIAAGSYLRNAGGQVCGVVGRDGEVYQADAVLIAAGIGTKNLAKVPMQASPGKIAFAASQPNRSLSRILVDTFSETHILQRRDGTLVAGGGYLQVGGSSSRPNSTSVIHASEILESSLALIDSSVMGLPLHSASADRPMPMDGLPAFGFVEPGLYAAVCHSAITLAPLLSSLVATEIRGCIVLKLLESYRPTRFRLSP